MIEFITWFLDNMMYTKSLIFSHIIFLSADAGAGGGEEAPSDEGAAE